jgi:hypothetical protein
MHCLGVVGRAYILKEKQVSTMSGIEVVKPVQNLNR